MTDFYSVNLDELNPPLIYPNVDEEAEFEALKAIMIDINPDYAAALELDSEEITITLQTVAVHFANSNQDCNEGVLQQHLRYASGENLAWRAEIKGVGERHMIDPGDPKAIPPITPTYELDEAYRERIQEAPEGYSTAGPKGAYIYHAKAADPLVKDAYAYDNGEGQEQVAILSHEGDGAAGADLVQAVLARLSADDIRPDTDDPNVFSAEILRYQISATIKFLAGVDQDGVLSKCWANLRAFITYHHRIGDDITTAGIIAALFCDGVQNVVLHEPAADMIVLRNQAAYCDPDADVALANGGVDG